MLAGESATALQLKKDKTDRMLIRHAIPMLLLALGTHAAAQNAAIRVACDGDAVGAEITVNGRRAGACPLDQLVTPGAVKVEAMKRTGTDHERRYEQRFELGPGAVKRLDILLGPPQLTSEAMAREQARLEAERQAAARREYERLAAEERARQEAIQALALLVAQADAGDAQAMFQLSRLHAEGSAAVPRNPQQGLAWLQKASERGHAAASLELATRLTEGDGIPKDHARALALLRPLAATGDAAAMTALGSMHGLGQGTPQDRREAYRLYIGAAQKGHAGAANAVGVYHMRGHIGPPDEQQAMEWFQKAAAAGDPAGTHNVGELAYKTDKAVGCGWFQRGAALGQRSSMTVWGKCLQEGTGVAADQLQAVHWMKKASELGETNAHVVLGHYYSTGKGVARDFAEALRLFRKAHDAGDQLGTVMLGLAYWSGEGVPRDVPEGTRLLQIAAQAGNELAKDFLSRGPRR